MLVIEREIARILDRPRPDLRGSQRTAVPALGEAASVDRIDELARSPSRYRRSAAAPAARLRGGLGHRARLESVIEFRRSGEATISAGRDGGTQW